MTEAESYQPYTDHPRKDDPGIDYENINYSPPVGGGSILQES